ncbi:MAG: hypothetical protein ABW321_11830 [Polyangiales bacterium]
MLRRLFPVRWMLCFACFLPLACAGGQQETPAPTSPSTSGQSRQDAGPAGTQPPGTGADAGQRAPASKPDSGASAPSEAPSTPSSPDAGTPAQAPTTPPVRAAGSCTSHAECKLYDDMCGSCRCLAFRTDEQPPECTQNKVECVVAPCRNKRAMCVTGKCTPSGGGSDEM